MLDGTGIIITAGYVIALAVVSTVDIAFANANKVGLRRLVDGSKGKAAVAISLLLDTRTEVLTSVHILIQLLIVSGAVLLFTALQSLSTSFAISVTGSIISMMVVVLLFRHLIPRIVTERKPELVLAYLFPVLKVTHLVLGPFSRFVISAASHVYGAQDGAEPEKQEETSEEEIQAFIDAGEEEGILERDEGEMIQSIVQFGDKVARDVMTPRTQIVAIDANATVEKLLHLVVTKRHARIPVYRDDLDNIEGIVHERDLLRVWQRADKIEKFRWLIKPAYFVPETKPVDDLLQEMKQKSDQMVIVIDEYGGVSGLITMEDLIEEIVGEIYDESERGEKAIEESNGAFVVPGALELGLLEDKMGVPLVSDTDCTTVGGAVIELFGRVPSPGEKIEHGGVEIQVLDADRRRVRRVRIKPFVPRRMTS